MTFHAHPIAASTTPIVLPPEVERLHWRQREIATVVYASSAATAQQVGQRLSAPLRNASIRSGLNRLVAKGILKRTQSGMAFVYLPALTTTDSRTLALRQFADDFFSGCLHNAASTMNALLGTGH